MTGRTSSERDHCIRITGIRMRRSIRRTSPALRRPGEMAPRDATNTAAQAWPTTILQFPRVSRWAPKESICDFRADFFNLFNHTNFANPVGSQSSGNFGKITATVASATATAVGTTAGVVGGGPRVIQGALRVEF